MSFEHSSPSLTLRPKAPTSVLEPLSLVDDTIFKLLYAGNETNLRVFLSTRTPLDSNDNLSSLYRHVKDSGEPGPSIQYDNIPYSLSAMRKFLQDSVQGKQLLSYFAKLLRVQGGFMVKTAEMLAFDVYVKMVRALHINQNDKKLREHIINIVPEARYTITAYTAQEKEVFEFYAGMTRQHLQDAAAIATTELVQFKTSKEFPRRYRQLIKAHEVHESKLAEVRHRVAKKRGDRKAKIANARARNEAGQVRQMGMSGLTPHTAHVEQSVVGYVAQTANEFFPHFGEEEEANSEDPMLEPFPTAF
ncbi:hypothetical protein H2200_002110 [Cladophialophora chaetospira]|uniref:Uncharacterized protein n=1 Tax=Cladophialophora chaetospira TaxID=386627 RepID=A0AA39CMR4_9EURO|nr:hypothetical protein H2200_002110 [Cladophialophora chaetospira]